MEQKTVKIRDLCLNNRASMALIAGPCQIESREHAVFIAGKMVEITKKLGLPYIFKASFDKANRTSINSARGVGLEEGMRTFAEIRKLYPDLPILTDIHECAQCAVVAEYVDVLQIPAFLCRQTDLVVAAAKTGKVVNIKKGQFLAPWDVKNIVKKVEDSGNHNICITERGTSFGYNTLVTDMRAFPQMAKDTGYPLIFDATHSVQQPGGLGGTTGGQREFAPVLARAAVAVGVAGVFIETHENPDKALSDGPNSIALADMERVLSELMAFDNINKTMIKDY
ncbi:MAG: 3-deoxy-8-phosphooctulonate synthase [Alphaproteobacteria bacterium]|nr:3-deoxy-8-phosphooctulonate synthase [Alphaproteobacteria bacterium]MBR3502394.1 3-deoxy-8-phosphooctulonate synthase [Alphaproteobacteria bacterium]